MGQVIREDRTGYLLRVTPIRGTPNVWSLTSARCQLAMLRTILDCIDQTPWKNTQMIITLEANRKKTVFNLSYDIFDYDVFSAISC